MGNEPLNADLNGGVTQERYNQPEPADATYVTSIPKEHNIGWLVSKYNSIKTDMNIKTMIFVLKLEVKGHEIMRRLVDNANKIAVEQATMVIAKGSEKLIRLVDDYGEHKIVIESIEATDSFTKTHGIRDNEFLMYMETYPGCSVWRQIAYSLQYPEIASHIIGDLRRVTENFQETIGTAIGHKNNERGSYQNAIRHTLWQALITRDYGITSAERAGNAHEHNAVPTNWSQRKFKLLPEADTMVDIFNNIKGRMIGKQYPNATNKGIMKEVMDEFYKSGLWTAFANDNDGYIMQKTKITLEEYNLAIKEIDKCNEDGKVGP